MDYELKEVEMQIAIVENNIRQYQKIQKILDVPDEVIKEKIDNALDTLSALVKRRDELKNK